MPGSMPGSKLDFFLRCFMEVEQEDHVRATEESEQKRQDSMLCKPCVADMLVHADIPHRSRCVCATDMRTLPILGIRV